MVLIHAVGQDLTYWDRQIEALRPEYNVVAFDLPGHGRSPVNGDEWTFANVAEQVAELIEFTSSGPVHLVGISFGSMIAQTLAILRSDLLRSLTLIGTAATFPEDVRQGMRARAKAIRSNGMRAVLNSTLERWFTPETRSQRPDIIDRTTKTLLGDDPETQAAIWDLISTLDTQSLLRNVRCPALVLVGELDPSTTPSSAHMVADALPDAQLAVIPEASHIVTVEAPTEVNKALRSFLTSTLSRVTIA